MGADAVISALGPIAEETTTEISDATRVIVDAMERLGPRRIVIAANAKVLDDSEVTGAYANVAAEHRRDAAILRESRPGLDASSPRRCSPTTRATGAVVPVVDGKAPGRSITRGDFATALLDAIGNGRVDRSRRRRLQPTRRSVRSRDGVPRSRRSETGARRREAPHRGRGVAHHGDPRRAAAVHARVVPVGRRHVPDLQPARIGRRCATSRAIPRSRCTWSATRTARTSSRSKGRPSSIRPRLPPISSPGTW